MSTDFRPQARIHRPAEYVLALKGKRIASGAFFVVHSPRKISSDVAACSRLGMIIAKRYAALAVSRNAIKRVIRESYRLHRNQLPKKDLVIRLVKPIPSVSLKQLKKLVRTDVDALLDRIA